MGNPLFELIKLLLLFILIYYLVVFLIAKIKGCSIHEAQNALHKEFKGPYPLIFWGNYHFWSKIDKYNIAVIGSVEAYKRIIDQVDEEHPFYFSYENCKMPFLKMTFPVKDRVMCSSLKNKYIKATQKELKSRGYPTSVATIENYNSFFDLPSVTIYFSRDSDEYNLLKVLLDDKNLNYLNEKLYKS